MVKLLKLTFQNPNGRSDIAKTAALERAHKIAAWPGLVWKLWIAEAEQMTYGGIYLFEDEDSALAYVNGPVAESIRAIPGIYNYQTQLFDVNEELSRMTYGVLSAEQARSLSPTAD